MGGGYGFGERGLSNGSLRWVAHHACEVGVPIAGNFGNTVQPWLDEPGNTVFHDENDGLLDRIVYGYEQRDIPTGDRVHLSAILPEVNFRLGPGWFTAQQAQRLFDRMYPNNQMNNDDHWMGINLP